MKKIEDYTADELYDLYKTKFREESEGSNLARTSFLISLRRSSSEGERNLDSQSLWLSSLCILFPSDCLFI